MSMVQQKGSAMNHKAQTLKRKYLKLMLVRHRRMAHVVRAYDRAREIERVRKLNVVH